MIIKFLVREIIVRITREYSVSPLLPLNKSGGTVITR